MKDDFYEKLQEALGRVVRYDILLCIGDFNAVLGRSNEGFEKCMGKLGAGSRMNENGIRIKSFCLANDLVIGAHFFNTAIYTNLRGFRREASTKIKLIILPSVGVLCWMFV